MILEDLKNIVLKPTVITDKAALDTGTGIPNLWDVKHRDDVIEAYVHHMRHAVKGKVPGNLFVYGKYGTGKTMITQLVMGFIAQLAAEHKVTVTPVYIPCQSSCTDMSFLKKLISELETAAGVPHKTCAYSCDARYARIVELLNAIEGPVITIFDEVDKLKTADRLNSFARIKENRELDKNICMVCITNDATFTNRLEPQTRSALCETDLTFLPYDAVELGDILRDRANRGLAPNSYDEMVIPLCAAYAAQEHGDARRAISLLKTAAEICEQEGVPVITEHHVKLADAKIEATKLTALVSSLPGQSKLTLRAICALARDKVKPITSGRIYEQYRSFAEHNGMDVLTHRRVTDLVSELEGLGILTTSVESRGRKGRSVEVDLSVEWEYIVNILNIGKDDTHHRKTVQNTLM